MGNVLVETNALQALTDNLAEWMKPLLSHSLNSVIALYWSGFLYHLVLSNDQSMVGTSLPVLVHIFGRKNRKMFDRDHGHFFSGLKERIDQQFDFRVMFLDPDAPPGVLFGAHRDNDLADQLRASIMQARKILGRYEIDARECCRLYRISRTISFMVIDEVVVYSTLALDEKGRSQPLTNSPFTVVSASAPMAIDMVKNFETLWKLGSPVRA